MATKVSASTTPHLLNVNWKPNTVVHPPTEEAAIALEREEQRDPPTTGGSTMGSTTSARTSARPGKRAAREHVRERDAEDDAISVDHSEHSTESRIASRAAGVAEVVPQTSLQGVRCEQPDNGSTKNAIATRARSDRDERHPPPPTAH